MRRRGLTLIEILLSVAIISISAIIIVKVFISADTVNNRTRDHDIAVFSAVSMMEQIHYEDIEFLFSDVPDASGFRFMDGFEDAKKVNTSWSMKKEMEDGMFAAVRFDIGDATVTVEIDIFRNESIYQLSRTFYRRSK